MERAAERRRARARAAARATRGTRRRSPRCAAAACCSAIECDDAERAARACARRCARRDRRCRRGDDGARARDHAAALDRADALDARARRCSRRRCRVSRADPRAPSSTRACSPGCASRRWRRRRRALRRARARRSSRSSSSTARRIARFCDGARRTPGDAARAGGRSPPCPTGAFKELALRSFPARARAHVFRTSGTHDRRGAARCTSTRSSVYEASLLPSFARVVLPDLAPGERVAFRVLAPSPARRRDSSLSHMFGTVLREARRRRERASSCAAGSSTRRAAARARSRRAARGGARVALCGTAFAFVHLLERARRARPRARAAARGARDGDGRLQGPLARACRATSSTRGSKRARRPAGAHREPVRDDRARQPVLRLGAARARARRAASSARPGRACAILDPDERRRRRGPASSA